MNEKTLNKTYLRSIQYWFEDGIVELGIGGMFLLIGGYFYLQAVLENSSLADWISGFFALVFIGAWYLVQYFIRSAKEQITFPRTGYVAYRQKEGNRIVRMGIAMVTAMLMGGILVFLVMRQPTGFNLMSAISGLLTAFVLGLMGFRSALPRFYLLAIASLILGGVFAISKLNNVLGLAVYCLAIGLVLAISGGIVLGRYLRTNPAPTEAGDDK